MPLECGLGIYFSKEEHRFRFVFPVIDHFEYLFSLWITFSSFSCWVFAKQVNGVCYSDCSESAKRPKEISSSLTYCETMCCGYKNEVGIKREGEKI